jgi:hypothetical protein
MEDKRKNRELLTNLITKGMPSNDNGNLPTGNKEGNILADDGLTEDSASEDVPDGAVGGLPHLLELEFLNAGLVGGDGGAFDAHIVLLDCVGGIDGDLGGSKRF